jgi:hypothetical protein
MSYKTTATVTSFICFCLAGVWAFGSAILLNLWGVDYASSAGFVGKRGAALFLGLGVMLSLTRDAEPSKARTSLTVGLIVAFTTLALLGVLEFALGNAGFWILSAVIVELMIALAFLRIELMTPYRTRVTDLSANTNDGRGRQVTRFVPKPKDPTHPSERMRQAIDSPKGRQLYSQRIGTVEPVFANIRHNKRLTRFNYRGREKVNTQWNLYCMVHNIKKLSKTNLGYEKVQ